jgi:phosphate transport system substrate-binding protein
MWQQEKKDGVIVNLLLSLALATSGVVANLFVLAPTQAESKSDFTTFPLPQTLEDGIKVRIDGSASLVMINQSLKDTFENQFSGTQIEVGVNSADADAALKALLEGKIDIAAIARDLTPAEKARGLEQVHLHREKIAIIVGANNPFQGSLTPEKFAKILRGEIKDWSELGGQSGKIRLIDRPSTSDTRNAFRDYSVFQTAEFPTRTNPTQIAEDKTAQIIQQLGTDGISYVIANQVSKLLDVGVLKIKGVTPGNSQYRFSQPLVYVYKQNPNPGVVGFLSLTLVPVRKKALEPPREAEASAIAASSLQSVNRETLTTSSSKPQPLLTAAPSESSTISTTPQSQTPTNTLGSGNQQQFVSPLENDPLEDKNVILLIVLSLLPIFGLGGFLTWWFKRKLRSVDEKTNKLETLISSTSTTETISITPEDYSILPYVENGTCTNGISHLNQSTTSTSTLSDKEYLNLTQEDNVIGNLATATVTGTNTRVDHTNDFDIPTETIAVDCGEVVWDTEAPVAVVNTPYPSVPRVSGITFDVELLTYELTTSLSELLDNPAAPFHQDTTTPLSELLDNPAAPFHQNTTTPLSEVIGFPPISSDADSSTSLSELLGMAATSLDTDSSNTPIKSLPVSTKEPITSLSELLGLPPETLDLDIAPSKDETTSSLPELLDELGELFNNLAEAELKMDLTPEEFSSDLSISSMFSEDTIDYAILKTDTKIEVSSELQIRTNITEFASLLDIDTDSSIVFTPRTPKWAYVSWYVSETHKEALRKKGGRLLAVRLYDATDIDLSYQTPQLVQQYECEEATCDRYIDIPTSNRDYITEIGYATDNNCWLGIARSGTIRIFNRPSEDFWFVTDTELVIHGSTEPGAKVSIDGHEIEIQPDGTFNFRVPFSNSLLQYLMTATAARGEQTITILKKFSQENPED